MCRPAAVTMTSTAPVPAGLSARIRVLLITKSLDAGVVPKSTAVTPVNPVPVIVTLVPPTAGPKVGLKPVTVVGVIRSSSSSSRGRHRRRRREPSVHRRAFLMRSGDWATNGDMRSSPYRSMASHMARRYWLTARTAAMPGPSEVLQVLVGSSSTLVLSRIQSSLCRRADINSSWDGLPICANMTWF